MSTVPHSVVVWQAACAEYRVLSRSWTVCNAVCASQGRGALVPGQLSKVMLVGPGQQALAAREYPDSIQLPVSQQPNLIPHSDTLRVECRPCPQPALAALQPLDFLLEVWPGPPSGPVQPLLRRVQIRDLLTSPVLAELMELRVPSSAQDASGNGAEGSGGAGTGRSSPNWCAAAEA